jgi:hypothetical protein
VIHVCMCVCVCVARQACQPVKEACPEGGVAALRNRLLPGATDKLSRAYIPLPPLDFEFIEHPCPYKERVGHSAK